MDDQVGVAVDLQSLGDVGFVQAEPRLGPQCPEAQR